MPFGFFFAAIFSGSRRSCLKTILVALLASTIIEITQFLTYLGTLDVDDIISNSSGAIGGFCVYKAMKRLSVKPGQERMASGIMIAASVIGCIIVTIFD